MGGTAARDEMIKQAIRRMEAASVDWNRIKDFADNGIVPFAVNSIAAEYGRPSPEFTELVAKIEERDGALIFYGLENAVSRFDVSLGVLWSLLYVPADRNLWDTDYSLDLGEQMAYVSGRSYTNKAYPAADAGEDFDQITLERITVKSYFGGLVRIR